MRVIDLFCGCGGMSLGFLRAGFPVVGAFDNWEKAVRVYNANFFDHQATHRDLSNAPQDLIAEINDLGAQLIVGGPPCQDFSSAGKRNENLGRGDLTLSFANIVVQSRVPWFVMENVDRTLRTKKYHTIVALFKAAGYGLTEKVLNASLYGVPQVRRRLFLIGHLGAEDGFLVPYLNRTVSSKPLTVREYFGDSLELEYYYRHPRNYSRRAVFSVDEPSPTIRGVNRPIPRGYPGHVNDATSYLSLVRPLTTRERASIQTFPETFQFAGTKTDVEQMIGNAVPVLLAEFVARCIKSYVGDLAKTQSTLIETAEIPKTERASSLAPISREVIGRFSAAWSVILDDRRRCALNAKELPQIAHSGFASDCMASWLGGPHSDASTQLAASSPPAYLRAAWPRLPGHIRESIIALVDSRVRAL